MSGKILVDPQELRDTGADFHHSSAEIERITTDLRNAAADLDTGCWPAGEAARLTARFAAAEAEGRRLARQRAELGDTLMRAADAFERADMATVQASLGLAPGSGKVPGLASPVLRDQTPALKSSGKKPWTVDKSKPAPWEDDGFAWWAEAFERDHGRPPTIEDYLEFTLVWTLSGEGQVAWIEADWEAFYYARQAGLLRWMSQGLPPKPMTGREVLAWVEALNAKQQASELVEEPAPVNAPPGVAMYVTGAGDTGLNLRKTPEIRDDNRVLDSGIPDGAEVYVHPDFLLHKDNVREWRYVTYIDAQGVTHIGWVATAYLEETKPGAEATEDASTTPTPTPETPAPPVQPPPTGMPIPVELDPVELDPADPQSFDNCVRYAMARRSDLGYPGGSSASDYITTYNVETTIGQIANANTDLTTIIAVGYAIVWPPGHDLLGGYDGGHGHIAIVEEVHKHYIIVSHANFESRREGAVCKDGACDGRTELAWSGDESLELLYIIGPTNQQGNGG